MAKNAAEFPDPRDLDDAQDPPSPEVQTLLDAFQKDLDQALHGQAAAGRDPKDPGAADSPGAVAFQRDNIEAALTAAKTLADGMSFATAEQRQEFAHHASFQVLEGVHSPQDLRPNGWENLQHADHLAIVGAAIADRLSVYDTAGRSAMDRQTAFAVQILSNGADPEQADGYFSSYARLQSHRREEGPPLDTSPEFTPERYQHETLTQFQQTLLNQAFLAIQDRFPNTAAHGTMNYLSIDDQLERWGGVTGSRHEAMWRDLKLIFDNQEFPSKDAAQETAAALAGDIVQSSFGPPDPAAPADPALQYLQRNLADWLSAERPQFLSGGRQQFRVLNDALEFAAALQEQAETQPLAFPALHGVMETAGFGPAAQGVLLLTQENFQTSIAALQADSSEKETELKFIATLGGYMPEFRNGHEPGISPALQDSYAQVMAALAADDPAAFDQAVQFQQNLNKILTNWIQEGKGFYSQEVINAAAKAEQAD